MADDGAAAVVALFDALSAERRAKRDASNTAFGQRGECPECGRDIGLLPGGELRYHRDDGEPCPGRGRLPKGPA